MPFVQSLFCLKGKDNRERFIAIQLITTLSFLLLNAITPDSSLFLTIVLLMLGTISAFSVIRRQNDANVKQVWLFAPIVLFISCGLLVIFSEHNGFLFTFALPLISHLYLVSFQSQFDSNSYQLGYLGPIDLTSNQKNHHQTKVQRVEPTLAGEQAVFADSVNESNTTYMDEALSSNPVLNNQEDDWGAQARAMLSKYKVQIALVVSIVFLLTVVSIIALSNNNIEQAPLNVQPLVKAQRFEQNNIVNLEDGFSVASNQHQGIIISWQADETLRTLLWDITTGEGDNSCQQLTFNNKQAIRTTKVLVEGNSQYQAIFSPLDSKLLVNQLAKRGSFKLCGYDFSLKGSQAALGKVRYYGEFLSY